MLDMNEYLMTIPGAASEGKISSEFWVLAIFLMVHRGGILL